MARAWAIALVALGLAATTATATQCPLPTYGFWYGGWSSPALISSTPGLLTVEAQVPILRGLLGGKKLGTPTLELDLGPTYQSCCRACQANPNCVAFDAGRVQSTAALENQIGNTGILGDLLNSLLDFLGQNVISINLNVITYCNLYGNGAELVPANRYSVIKLDLSSLEGLTGIPKLQALNLDDAQAGVVFNPCAPNPCQNGGACSVVNGQPVCDCTGTGCSGNWCETPLPTCNPNPCLHGGKCSIVSGAVKCTCPAGWKGARCQTPTCSPNPCKHGGKCSIVNRASGSTAVCTCPAGWTGAFCGTPCCSPNPCLHGGRCKISGGAAVCDCTSTGYIGTHCETWPCGAGGCQG